MSQLQFGKLQDFEQYDDSREYTNAAVSFQQSTAYGLSL